MDAVTPDDLGLQIDALMARGLGGSPHPLFPGAVCTVDVPGAGCTVAPRGSRVTRWAGNALQYADPAGTPLPADAVRAVHENTVFDIASLTKLFTAVVILGLVEQGLLDLDAPVATHLPSYARDGRDRVTVRHLLTHSSGLPAEIFFWRQPSPLASRRAAVLACPLTAEPGTRFLYSCVGYITLGLLAEQLTGSSLDRLVRERVCAPLGLARTGYRPTHTPLGVTVDDIAATEMRAVFWSDLVTPDPERLDHRGIVHDENAAWLDGVSGNAGIFSTATEIATFGRALLDGLTDESSPLGLSTALVRTMLSPQLPDGLNPDHQSGLGFRIDDAAFMGAMTGTGQAYGHTGFTGTSLVLDEARDTVVALMTNRVHPTRDWSQLQTFRRELHDLVAHHTGGDRVRRPCRNAEGS